MTKDNTKGVMDGVEPAAIRTFDGEGDYSLRVYEDNETYLQEFEERNPRHVGWVDYLYTADQFAEREAALLERIMELEETCAYDGAILRKIGHLLRYIDGTKYSGTYDVGVKAIMDERDQLRLQLAALLEGLEAGPTFAEAEPQALKLLGEAIAGQAKEIVSVSQQLAAAQALLGTCRSWVRYAHDVAPDSPEGDAQQRKADALTAAIDAARKGVQ